MNYVSFLNSLFKEEVEKADNLAIFGQNITLGSCLGGLCRGLKVKKNGLIINSPNVENTLVGLGFGAMLNNVNTIFFVKQLDFVLLGIDPLVNTYNYIRRLKPTASFTIVPTIVDIPYQGHQSSLNNLPDFCSIARIPGYVLTNQHDAEDLIRSQLVKPGFRFLCPSHRFYKEPLISFEQIYFKANDFSVYQFMRGQDATVVTFNFTLPQGIELIYYLRERNVKASLFNITLASQVNWQPILEEVQLSKQLIVLDDTKGTQFTSDQLILEALKHCQIESLQVLRRDFSGIEWLCPNPEILTVDYASVHSNLLKKLSEQPAKLNFLKATGH